jgi:hypothetical protein
MDDEYWAAYRKRVRRRASSQMALIICPLIIAVAVWSFFSPMDHPSGDIRDTIPFRLLVSAYFGTLGLGGLVVSVRWLLADRKRP